MKRLLLLTLVIGLSNFFAPNLYAKKYDVVSFDEIQDIRKGTTNSYITSKGETFTVGDKIELGLAHRNDFYSFIIQSAGGGAFTYPLRNAASGSKVTITKINWRKKLVRVSTTKADGNNMKPLVIINLEGALERGEVLSGIMSKEEAIAKLKEAKDLLELEVITQTEYNALKEELTPIIRN